MSYGRELAIAWVIRCFLMSALLAMVASLAACGTNDKPRSLDLAVKGLYTPGLDASTRNQIPQGGTDEKSDSTPKEPAR